MKAQVDDVRHAAVAAVVGLRSELSALSSAPVWGLSTTDTETALLEVSALATQAAQLQMRLLAHADPAPGMCHAHHDVPRSRGGSTDVKAGRLLCPRHHTLAHDNRYQLRASPYGKVIFTRRT